MLGPLYGAYYGLDIAYSEKQKGYILRNPPFEAYELRLIVDSVQASKFITQTEAKRLTEKSHSISATDAAKTSTAKPMSMTASEARMTAW